MLDFLVYFAERFGVSGDVVAGYFVLTIAALLVIISIACSWFVDLGTSLYRTVKKFIRSKRQKSNPPDDG